MAFPLTPANNQVALVNGIEYYYNTSKGAWYRYGDVTANVITSNTFQVLSSIIFTDGTSQNSAVNPIDSYARTTANAAFTQANTNANNISITNGVDATQNTRLNSIETINIDQNTAISIIQGTDATQNVRLNSIETVNVGQNTSISIIQGVDSTQNTNITIATNAATGAFEQANATAGGLTTANGRMSIIEGVDATQNTNITVADTKAQAAFDKANSANVLAQAAYNQANTGGGGGGTLDQYARNTANSASSNTIIIQGVDSTQNTQIQGLQGVDLATNSAISVIQGVDLGQNTTITAVNQFAQASYNTANSKFNSSGGTISGDVSVTGNLTVTGETFYANVTNLNVDDSFIVLNANTVGSPVFNSGIEIDRGTSNNTLLFWNESNKYWNYTDDESNEYVIASESSVTNSITPVNQFTQSAFNTANSANVLARAAFDSSNAVNGYAVSAFATANGANGLASGAYAQANTNANNISITNGVDATQNTNITIADTKAQAAFDKANAANSLAQAAYNQANTGGGGTLDQFARDTANSASSNTIIIQGVDVGQNTRMTIIEGVNTTQNTTITAVNQFAQAAYNQANTSITTSGGTITGSLNVSQDLAVTGNLFVLGSTTSINTSSFTVADSLIVLGVGNYTTDLLDIGISGHYNDGTNAHTGFIRDPGTKEWYVFKGYTPIVDANNNININDASFAKANVNADYFKGNVVFSDGTTQSSAATGIDSYARTTSNTATDNITILQGVNTTQNTNITAVNQFAQAAYNQANTGGGGTLDQYARDTANGANGLAAGAYTTANTKYNSTGGTISGSVTVSNDLTVNGNVSFIGNVTSINNLAGNVLALTASTASNTSVGYLGVPQRVVPMGGSDQLVLSDAGKQLYLIPTSNVYSIFIPSNATVPFPVGTAIVTVLTGPYTSNVAPLAGVTLRMAGNTSGANIARTLGSYSMASLLKVENDVWFISGSGVT